MNRYLKALIVSAVMVVLSIAGTTAAQATDCGELGQDCFSRVYAGITGGEASLSSDTLRAAFTAIDEENIAYGFVFGYRMNKFFGLESVGNYLGSHDFTNGPLGPEMDTRFCNLGGAVNFYLPLGEVISDPNLNFISLFAKVGMHYWDAEADDPSTALTEYEDDGVDPFLSMGINLDLSRVLTLRAEYSSYELGADDKVTTQSMNLLFKF